MSLPEPMPCLKDRCWSPIACNGFGYCRERNFDAARSYDEGIRALREKAERGEPVTVFGQTVEVSDAKR